MAVMRSTQIRGYELTNHCDLTSKICTVTSEIYLTVLVILQNVHFLILMNPKTHHINWEYYYTCLHPNMFVVWWPSLRRISPSLQVCPFFCYSWPFVAVNITASWVWWHFHTSAQLSFSVPKILHSSLYQGIQSNDLTGRSCLSVHMFLLQTNVTSFKDKWYWMSVRKVWGWSNTTSREIFAPNRKVPTRRIETITKSVTS